jgi:calcium-dependent protein kinase
MSEYCEGGELFDAITSKGFYSELDAAKIIKQILQAVTYLHDNNIIHRDLKPENIMLLSNKNNETSLKLIDFGTVVEKPKFGNKLTKFIGTSYYIAPEVIKESYDEKCDVWSCGIILYILLCGYPPFNGASNHEIYNAIKFSKLIFQKEEWTDISKEAIELITFMLDKNPSTRPSAYECLNHKWFKVCEGNISHTFLHSNTLITNKTKLLDSMARFVQQNKFKQAVLQFISTEFNLKKEEEELKKMFKEFDNEDKGTISREVFIKQIEKLEESR